MQIIVPMSGFGERFRKVGYKIPKPLIKINGIEMIGHVINLFPGESNFLFICNKDHLSDKELNMEMIIKKYCKTAQIVGIEPHKLGPVHAVLKQKDKISLNEEVIINYCDFSCIWNWNHFKKFVKGTLCDGAIPAYKGFHPHSLGNTNYAYMQESKGWVSDIQEKKPFTDNRMNEYASSGTYYFKNGQLLINSLSYLIEKNCSINGEYYVSLAYKKLLIENKQIAVYPLQHFFQWGTPEDLEEFIYWSKIFKLLVSKNNINKTKSKLTYGSLIMPMAGLGTRFSNEGYKMTKPLIPVSGKPMIMQALNDLPNTDQKIFVIRNNMNGYKEIIEIIKIYYPEAKIKLLSKLSPGQASTVSSAIDLLNLQENYSPITIGACDNGAIYDEKILLNMVREKKADILVWCSKNHPNSKRNPNMYGWIEADNNGLIKKVSVKKMINNNEKNPIIIGTFTFLKEEFLSKSLERLFKRKGLVNGEFYLDSCINDAIQLGLRCYIFEVDAYVSWGTPNDLKTFEYMQSAFHKWKFHEYNLNDDPNVNKDKLLTLNDKYKEIAPNII